MRYIIIGILCLVTQLVHAQKFKAGLIAGINLSQVQGDNLAGYDKFGITGGAFVSYPLKPKMDLIIEFLYSQEGSKTSIVAVDTEPYIKLNYINIPVLVSVKDWEMDGYYKVYAEGGLFVGNLMTSKSNFAELESLPIRKQNLGFILGVGFNFTEKITMGFRYSRSVIPLIDAENIPNLIGYYITLRMQYAF